MYLVFTPFSQMAVTGSSVSIVFSRGRGRNTTGNKGPSPFGGSRPPRRQDPDRRDGERSLGREQKKSEEGTATWIGATTSCIRWVGTLVNYILVHAVHRFFPLIFFSVVFSFSRVHCLGSFRQKIPKAQNWTSLVLHAARPTVESHVSNVASFPVMFFFFVCIHLAGFLLVSLLLNVRAGGIFF